MAVRCRKSGFPIACPDCGRRSGRPNGWRHTRATGRRQQVRCSVCKRQWLLPSARVEPVFGGQRIHLSRERLLQAIALVVVGVPLDRVEGLLGIKGETIKAKIVVLLEAEQWEALSVVLEERFRIPEWHRSEFHRAIVVGMHFEPSAFRCWSKEFRRRDQRDQAKDLRLIGRILGRPVKASEIIPDRRRRRKTHATALGGGVTGARDPKPAGTRDPL